MRLNFENSQIKMYYKYKKIIFPTNIFSLILGKNILKYQIAFLLTKIGNFRKSLFSRFSLRQKKIFSLF